MGETRPCPECEGTGTKSETQMAGPESVERVERDCRICRGSGEVTKRRTRPT